MPNLGLFLEIRQGKRKTYLLLWAYGLVKGYTAPIDLVERKDKSGPRNKRLRSALMGSRKHKALKAQRVLIGQDHMGHPHLKFFCHCCLTAAAPFVWSNIVLTPTLIK